MLAVTEEIGRTLLSAKTSHEAWQSLPTSFLTHTAGQEDLLEQQWRDLRRDDQSMLKFINAVKKQAPRFAQIRKPKTPAEVNRRIYTGLASEREFLILEQPDTMVTMTLDELTSLLMGPEERRAYAARQHQPSPNPPAPLSSILGPPPAEVHFRDGRDRGGRQGKGKGKGGRHGSSGPSSGHGSGGYGGSGYSGNPSFGGSGGQGGGAGWINYSGQVYPGQNCNPPTR
ncbi:hypothetical protein CDL15_Pgr010572 [Punica granatum]|uniref:Uncharacterized protein n=1 Tax=Punica granatum TaxID=22663 RepID=A0A218WVX7_PUNGR|nr:hypothetical protein CDL15_Pgr010572 [Punica granatum]